MAIEVNANDWDGLSADDRAKIERIIAQNFEGQTIEPGAGGAAARANPACQVACNVAEAAAVAACNALPPPANLVCMAVAHEAGNFCRSQC